MKLDFKSSTLVIALTVSMPILAAQPGQPWDCAAGKATASSAATRLNAHDAIEIAAAAAKTRGYDPAKIRQTGICFDSSRRPHAWTVFFETIEAGPGRRFQVWIQDDTGKARLKSSP